MMTKPMAFLKKDLLIESSYAFAFLADVFGIFVSLLSYYFIDRLFGNQMAPALREFGVGYFPYVLLASAFFSYVGVGMSSFVVRLNSEQSEGTLESVLATPTGISTILFSMALWNLVIATFNMAVYVSVGALFFGIDFRNINFLSTAVVLALTMVSFGSLGILSASFIMVFKRGNPVAWIVNGIEGLICGVYFPVAVLPGWMQALSNLFPITYAVRAFQLSVYRGYSIRQLSGEIVALSIFCLVLMPASLVSFRKAFDRACREGSLAQH
jgi:ABC-2 type transport system permease protein